MHKKLEQYSWFPYVAWTIFFIMLLVVAHFAFELRKTAENATASENSPFSATSRMNEVQRVFDEPSTNTTEENDSTYSR